MTQAPLTVRRWRRVEYERLVEAGLFHGDALELIDGVLLVAEPQGSRHAAAVGAADDALRAALPPGWFVRAQMPLALDDESEPEPDLAVVAGRRGEFQDCHPSRPALVIEVADWSLRFDREDKGRLYARAGIPDYWIVNLVDRVLEVHRDPGPDSSEPYGWRYRSVEWLGPSAIVTPLAIPSASMPVARLLAG